MAQDAIIILESLHCIRAGERFEPYIWPALVRIDDQTLNTPGLVSVTAPFLGDARVVLKSDMRAGESADIPTSVGTLRTRFDANVFLTHLILIIVLWDEDDTPKIAMGNGYQAFVGGIRAALGNASTLIKIKAAEDELEAQKQALKDAEADQDKEAIAKAKKAITEAEAQKVKIITAIQEQITDRVESAISDSLSGPDKALVAVGLLDLDDDLDSAFKSFSNAVPTAFALSFEKGPLFPGLGSSKFEIRGRLEVRKVVTDPCQAREDAVKAAQAGVQAVLDEIQGLRDDLAELIRNHGSRKDQDKIRIEIKRQQEEELPVAKAALARARTALSICRAGGLTDFPDEVIVKP